MRTSVIRVLSQSINADEIVDPASLESTKRFIHLLESSHKDGVYHITFHAKYLQSLVNTDSNWINTLRKLGEAKQLYCGPWYMLPNDCLANAETLVRNLFLGSKICYHLGNVMKVGYSALSCNNNSQLPQIFNGFNIDTICVPVSISQHLPKEFFWEGVDGSKALVLSSIVINTQESVEPTRLDEIIAYLTNDDRALSETPIIIIENNQSESERTNFKQIIDYLNASEKIQTEFISLPDHFWKVKDAVSKQEIRTLTREVIPDPGFSQMTYIKCMRIRSRNSNVVQTLQYYAEPWSVIQQCVSDENLSLEIQDCWELLLTLQSVINDCSEYDRISKNVIRNQYNKLLSKIDRAFIKAADVVVKKIKLPKNRNEYYFTVINPLPYNRTKITGVELEIPSSLALENISIEDLSGRKLPSVLVSKSDVSPVFDHHDDIAKSRYRCYLELSNFPALGYKTFKIVPVQKSAQFRRKNIITAEHTLENDFIRVAINANGTFNIYSKETGVIYKDLGYFVDTIQTDPGNPDEIKTIKSTTLSPVISQFENSALLGSFKIEYSWSQSDNIENNRVNITIVLSLDRLSRYVDITIDIVDKALNHKIAYFFPVHFKADHLYSDIRFDLQDISPIVNIKNLDHHPMSLNSLVGLCGEIAGFAIISKEIHLAHVTTKKHPSVSLPIIDKIAHQSIPPKGNNTAILKYHLSFYPYIGGWENGQILYDAYNRLFEMKSFMIGETDGSLPSQMEFIKIKPSNLCFSVLKTSETGNVILRFFNPTVKFIDGSIVSHYPLISAKVMSLEEYIIDTLELKDEHEITLLVPPKKIMTIELRMRCKEKNAA